MTNFILLLSPAGGGKTTLIRNTVPALAERGVRVAIVFNDDGDPEAVDMPREVRRYADLATMTAGCFGCDDADALVAKLQHLDGHVDVVFIEPIGFTAAGEMINVFGRAGITPTIVTLVDAEHLSANLRIGTLDGQVAAADMVLITKGGDDCRADALRYAYRHCSPGVMIRVYSVEDALDLSEIRRHHTHHHDHSEHCHHDHHHHDEHCHHDHGHHHGHGHTHIIPRHLRLISGTSFGDVWCVIDGDGGAIRAKGKVGDTRFSMVHGSWSVEDGDPLQPDFLTYYTVTSDDADRLIALLAPYSLHFRYASRGTADEVRDHHVDDGLLVETIERCEHTALTFVDGHPVSNPEWQELLNELRKRSGVSEELQARAVSARVAHLIACAEWYLAHSDKVASAPWQTLHGISVGVAWFCSEQPERVSEELQARAMRLPLVQWLARGLLGRVKTNSDLGREEVMADEAGITARWGSRHAVVTTTDHALLASAWAHSMCLAHTDGRPSVVSGWGKVTS